MTVRPRDLTKNCRLLLWALAIALGAAQAWTSRLDLSNDTVSYLDMGDYFFHGHPAALVNGIWGPLYAFLLGLTLDVFKPSIRSEYPEIHLLLFFVFLFALACFDFFLRQLFRFRDVERGEVSVAASDWPWLVVAYALFLWSSLRLIGVYESNPDMLVAAFFYLACGLLLRIAAKQASWKDYLGLGLILGLAYLTKGVMFPMALAICGAVWLLTERKNVRGVATTLAAFGALAVPYIVALSAQQGHPTFGETGKYNYAVHVNQVARHHWQATPGSLDGIPTHPTNRILDSAPAFEFAMAAPVTYPLWYDPMLWYQGLRTHLDISEQFRMIRRNVVGEWDTFFWALDTVFFTSFVLALGATRDKRLVGRYALQHWSLVALPILAFAMYSLVHYESRYIGPFFTVLGVVLFSCIYWADDAENHRLFMGIASLQVALLLANVAFPIARQLRRSWVPENGSYQEIAAGAQRMGLHPGDRIASVNFSNLGTVQWARLARVQIVAELYYWPDGPEGSNTSFWQMEPQTQARLLRQFAHAGARAVVSSDAPAGYAAAGWSRIGNTRNYLLWLDPTKGALN
jgi:hypothetical protein